MDRFRKAAWPLAYALLCFAAIGCRATSDAGCCKSKDDERKKLCEKASPPPRIRPINNNPVEVKAGGSVTAIPLRERFLGQNLPGGMTVKVEKGPGLPVKIVSQSKSSVELAAPELRNADLNAIDEKGEIATTLDLVAIDPICGVEAQMSIDVRLVKKPLASADRKPAADSESLSPDASPLQADGEGHTGDQAPLPFRP